MRHTYGGMQASAAFLPTQSQINQMFRNAGGTPTSNTTDDPEMAPLDDIEEEDQSLMERWSDLPAWGQYTIGTVAGIGGLFGLRAIARRFL